MNRLENIAFEKQAKPAILQGKNCVLVVNNFGISNKRYQLKLQEIALSNFAENYVENSNTAGQIAKKLGIVDVDILEALTKLLSERQTIVQKIVSSVRTWFEK